MLAAHYTCTLTLTLLLILSRDAILARSMLWSDRCLSVCLSVTSRCPIGPAKRTEAQSVIELVYRTVLFFIVFNGIRASSNVLGVG